MNASSSTKEISKKMESNRNNNNNMRRRRSRRYSPYTSSSDSMTNTNEKQQREEAVRLGVELSLLVSETMLMLSDDLDSVLVFCLKLLKNSGHRDFNGPVISNLFYVLLHVFETYIKPKNNNNKLVNHDHDDDGDDDDDGDGDVVVSVEKPKQISETSLQSFVSGIKELDRIVLILKKKKKRRDVVAADVAVKPSDFEQCNQTINKIKEETASLLLLLSKDDDIVSEEEEEIKAKAVHVWKSLFETTKRREDMRVSMVGLIQMFKPIFNQVRASVSSRLIQSLHI